MKTPRGILDYFLSGHLQRDVTWKLTGNLEGENYVDQVRGPLNEGGMFAERNDIIYRIRRTGSGYLKNQQMDFRVRCWLLYDQFWTVYSEGMGFTACLHLWEYNIEWYNLRHPHAAVREWISVGKVW